MKKMTKLSLMLLIMVLAMSTGLMAQAYSDGSGTSDDPYQISTTNDLIELSNTSDDWGLHFKQTANIAFDANEQNVDWDGDGTANWDTEDQKGFSPIGIESPDGIISHLFVGSYDGDGHTIDNLFINRSSKEYIGLFGYTSNATIENIGVTNIDITGYQYTGGLVGINYSTVSNSYSTGSVSGSSTYTGGLVGANYSSKVSNSYSTASVVSGYNCVGGLVGDNGSTVSNSYSTGSVSGTYDVGGLVGINSSTVSNSYSTGSVSGDNFVGGLVGINYSTVSNSYSTGSVSGTYSEVGGLVGYNYESTVNNSFWDTDSSEQSSSAGGTGKNTIEMKDVATFTDTTTAGLTTAWDFETNPNDDDANENHWDIGGSDAINSGYPFLSWQNRADIAHSDVISKNVIPKEFALHQNYPNPFNPTTTISYDLPNSSFVKIAVYDINGKIIEELVNKKQAPGNYKVLFNASRYSSGIYFYNLKTNQKSITKKMMVIK